ncbi:hypothetical protein BMA3022 [Burkholderia mallei ATCC 23344]|uniref:Uncharacterized protein n=4 Tax=pseudomallei group TaxID=111527 RepID=A0AAX1X5L4_BURML|nr:hypothetical protein BMA3022 [Burkholderia mallei ATCC 23344]KGX49906.1 hypothetical protein Y027_5598 [Burkholderia pseudomallei TSV5]MBM5577410.1 hypothetical protein [Burkholderia pseudomallei]RKN92175.1 hypothetical protein D8O31_28745 [Burkholderia mallei]MBM5583109.1 hypothetical protein [Burkholderia pseudomallei]
MQTRNKRADRLVPHARHRRSISAPRSAGTPPPTRRAKSTGELRQTSAVLRHARCMPCNTASFAAMISADSTLRMQSAHAKPMATERRLRRYTAGSRHVDRRPSAAHRRACGRS